MQLPITEIERETIIALARRGYAGNEIMRVTGVSRVPVREAAASIGIHFQSGGKKSPRIPDGEAAEAAHACREARAARYKTINAEAVAASLQGSSKASAGMRLAAVRKSVANRLGYRMIDLGIEARIEWTRDPATGNPIKTVDRDTARAIEAAVAAGKVRRIPRGVSGEAV